jgi:hypothetical protein
MNDKKKNSKSPAPLSIPSMYTFDLTANLLTILGEGVEHGYLRITLCGYGMVTPAIATVGMLADAGIPQLLGPQTDAVTPLLITLPRNNVITPAGTFYEIAVLDQNQNVIQTENYQFNGPGPFDLSTSSPVTPPSQGGIFPNGGSLGFTLDSIIVGTNIGPNLGCSRNGSFSNCVVIVKQSDPTVPFQFTIRRNNTPIFDAAPTVAAGAVPRSVSVFTNFTSRPLMFNGGIAPDVFTLDVLQGNSNWMTTVQLQP